MPHAVSRIRQIAVRGVLAERQVPRREILAKVRAAQLDQRTDHASRARADAREPTRGRAAHQPQQERLRLVVARVRDRDRNRTQTIRGTFEKRVSRPPRGVLDRSFLAERERADVSALDLDRDVERGGKAGAEPLVLVGVRAAQLMIQVRRARDDEDAVSLQLAREVQERDGIGAAGQGDDDTIAVAHERVTLKRAADAAVEAHGNW